MAQSNQARRELTAYVACFPATARQMPSPSRYAHSWLARRRIGFVAVPLALGACVLALGAAMAGCDGNDPDAEFFIRGVAVEAGTGRPLPNIVLGAERAGGGLGAQFFAMDTTGVDGTFGLDRLGDTDVDLYPYDIRRPQANQQGPFWTYNDRFVTLERGRRHVLRLELELRCSVNGC